MKKLKFCLLFLTVQISTLGNLYAQDFTLDVGTGFRQDTFNWNISGKPDGPNILSELEWKGLKIWEIYSELKVFLPYHIYFRFKGDYGKIFEGRNKDSDFLEDHRQQPFSISYSKANRGEVFDLSFGAGYLCTFLQDRLTIAPLVGFSHQEQHLRMIHGELVLDLFQPFLEGSMPNLHNHYRTQWFGPWAGFDMNYAIWNQLSLFGTYEYHWAFYDASGHWNLRTDFIDDFEHSGCGYGSLVKLGCKYNCSSLESGIFFKYQIMKMQDGLDKTFIIHNNVPTLATTKLNEVNWHTFSIIGTIGFTY